MISYSVQINGLEKLQRALIVAPEKTVNEISMAVQKSLVLVRSAAIKEAPVNKSYGGGNLRQKIDSRMTGKLTGIVISKAPYSAFVEMGTRAHIIVPVEKKVLANKRTGEFFGKIVHHPGTRANPFMTRALTQSKQQIQNLFKQAVKNALGVFG